MKIISFDVGLNGGIAVYKNGKFNTYKMPTKIVMVNNKKRRTYDIQKISEIIKNEKPSIALIEKIWTIPTDGRLTAFSFGYGYGIISALCESMIKNVEYISAFKWKRYFNIGSDKRKSVELCNKVFGTNFKLKDDGEAEALLIIKYYLEVNNE